MKWWAFVALAFVMAAALGGYDTWQETRSKTAIREFAMAHMDVHCKPPGPCLLLYRIDRTRQLTYDLKPGGGELKENALTDELLLRLDRDRESREFWGTRSGLALITSGVGGSLATKAAMTVFDTKAAWTTVKLASAEALDYAVANPVRAALRVLVTIAGTIGGYYVGENVSAYLFHLSPDSPAVISVLRDPAEWKAMRQPFFNRRVLALAVWDMGPAKQAAVSKDGVTAVKQDTARKQDVTQARVGRASAAELDEIVADAINTTSMLPKLWARRSNPNELTVDDFALLDRAEDAIVSKRSTDRNTLGSPSERGVVPSWLRLTAFIFVLALMLCASGGAILWLYRAFRRKPREEVDI